MYLPSDGDSLALLVDDQVNADYPMPKGELADTIREAFKENEEGTHIIVSAFFKLDEYNAQTLTVSISVLCPSGMRRGNHHRNKKDSEIDRTCFSPQSYLFYGGG